jgi:hypothetical protein
MIQHQDLIGVLDGAEPMRDDKAGPPRKQRLERVLNDSLGLRIHGAGGFVED